MRRPHRRADARDVALSTVPIHESGRLKRTHGERLMRFHGGGGRPAFGLWATYSIAASHLFETVRWLAPCNLSFPSPLRDSAGFTPAFRLTKLKSFAPTQLKSTRGSVIALGLRNAFVGSLPWLTKSRLLVTGSALDEYIGDLAPIEECC
jgi:hypothetical protein